MNRPEKAMQRIGNLVFNKAGSRKDQEAWEDIKKYIQLIEASNMWINKLTKIVEEQNDQQ